MSPETHPLLVVIPAIGTAYSRMARVLAASIGEWGWRAQVLILTDHPSGRPCETGVTSVHGKGKDVKTGFGHYLPRKHAGRILLLDADMIAIGAMPPGNGAVPLAPEILRGVKGGPVPSTREGKRFDSCAAWFPDVATAARFSAMWKAEWQESGRPDTDVPAFNRVAHDFGFAPFPTGPYGVVAPSIYHLRASILPVS